MRQRGRKTLGLFLQSGDAACSWVTQDPAFYKPSLLWTHVVLQRWTRMSCDLMEIVVCLGRSEQCDRLEVSKV